MKFHREQPEIGEAYKQSIISAIWILSCTDKIPQMTYKSIKDRLSIPADFNFRELIQERTELFRIGITKHQLAHWKDEMRKKRMRPTWIAKSHNEAADIDKLSSEEVFRNRFRNEFDAKPVPIEIIEWGLRHIDNLRKIRFEENERKIRKWSNLWIPILSLILVLTTIIVTAINNQNLSNLKKYEITIKPKQDGYNLFMSSLNSAFDYARKGIQPNMLSELNRIESAYYEFQPHMDEKDANKIWKKYLEFSLFCHKIYNVPKTFPDTLNAKFVDQYISYKFYFKDELSNILFYNK